MTFEDTFVALLEKKFSFWIYLAGVIFLADNLCFWLNMEHREINIASWSFHYDAG